MSGLVAVLLRSAAVAGDVIFAAPSVGALPLLLATVTLAVLVAAAIRASARVRGQQFSASTSAVSSRLRLTAAPAPTVPQSHPDAAGHTRSRAPTASRFAR